MFDMRTQAFSNFKALFVNEVSREYAPFDTTFKYQIHYNTKTI